VVAVAPSSSCRPHQNLVYLIPYVIAPVRVESERGSAGALPMTEQEGSHFLLIPT
jgi:hypothetical protein